jgi:hypothetical protein
MVTTNYTPQVMSVTPGSGSNASQIFRATIRDGNGVGDLQAVGFLIQSSINGAGAVYVWYDPVSNRVWLMNDAGTAWSNPATLGQNDGDFPSTVLSNSQASIDVSCITAVKSGTDLVLSIPVAFKPAFNGARNVYVYAVDNGNAVVGWQQGATFTVNSPANPTPAVLSVSPSSGVNASQLFRVHLSDSSGSGSINQLILLVQDGLTSGPGVAVYVQPQSQFNHVYLADDAGAWGTGAAIGSNVILSNSQAIVDASAVKVVGSGTDLCDG